MNALFDDYLKIGKPLRSQMCEMLKEAKFEGALVDRLVLRGFVLQSVAFALQPRDAVFAHEAGHFLAAYLLGVPAASLQLSPFAVGRGKGYLARVVWHSAEWDLAASAADIVAFVVL